MTEATKEIARLRDELRELRAHDIAQTVTYELLTKALDTLQEENKNLKASVELLTVRKKNDPYSM